jgi:hypothetical protein
MMLLTAVYLFPLSGKDLDGNVSRRPGAEHNAPTAPKIVYDPTQDFEEANSNIVKYFLEREWGDPTKEKLISLAQVATYELTGKFGLPTEAERTRLSILKYLDRNFPDFRTVFDQLDAATD